MPADSPPDASRPTPLSDADFDNIHAAQRRARRKALWWLFGGVTLLFALLLWSLVADEPPPDTSDLRVTFSHPPEHQNAYALLAKLTATLPPAPEQATPEERHFARIFSGALYGNNEDRVAWNQEVVAAVLSRYPPDLADRVSEALAARVSEAPETKSYADVLPEIGRFRHLACVLTQQASLAWHADDHPKAAELNLLALQFGNRVSQSQGPFITVLTGRNIQGIALDSIRRHTEAPTIPPAVLRRYLEQIGRHEIQIADYHTAGKQEHAAFAGTAHDFKALSPSYLLSPVSLSGRTSKASEVLDFFATLPGLWQPNRTIRWHAEITRTHISRSEPLPPGAADPGRAQVQSIIDIPWHRRIPNITGRVFLGVATPSFSYITTTGHRIRANLRLTQLYAALRLHHLEHDGDLPADLTELVPAYLPSIPPDPFDGQPLRYNRELTTIWSIDQKHLTITDADGDLPERRMPAFRLLFARPPVELPAFAEPAEQ